MADENAVIAMLDTLQSRAEHRADHCRFVPGRDEDGDEAAAGFAGGQLACEGAGEAVVDRRGAPDTAGEIDQVDGEVVDREQQEAGTGEQRQFARDAGEDFRCSHAGDGPAATASHVGNAGSALGPRQSLQDATQGTEQARLRTLGGVSQDRFGFVSFRRKAGRWRGRADRLDWPAMDLFFLAWASAVAAQPAAIVHAVGHWAALDRGSECEAASRSLRIAREGKAQARAGFAFDAKGPRDGQFYARLSREVRPGSSVMLTVGDRPFLLVSRGGWAWSRGPAQEAAIIAALRSNAGMKVEARSPGGGRIRDYYSLDGAPLAIDAAAACAARLANR